ncbi:hypothetical protein BJ912DRAFT_932597 [Pholiota molesta]|nr:hypothetical protein BJ912DRAFT_932597 [Pholiota molesta]
MSLQLPPPLRFPTAHLPLTQDYVVFGTEEMSLDERIERSHRRAKAIAMSYKPTLDDVLNCSEKFWNMHLDPINGYDGAAVTLWTLQLNLSGGTLAPFAKERPQLAALWQSFIDFKVTAHYMLTEVGHGLDAPNIETIAKLLPDGGFDLHTLMIKPQTSIPAGGVPRIAIVMARLNIKNHDFGVRPFIVPLNDGKTMCKGVTSRPLLPAADPNPWACHYSFRSCKAAGRCAPWKSQATKNGRLQFLSDIWRIGVGSICLTAVTIPALNLAAYIVAQYSKRRTVTTSHAPILHALAEAKVLEALYQELRIPFTDRTATALEQRNGRAVDRWRRSSITLADRCGAQGLFEHNQIIPMQNEIRGVTIAEGDVLVLSIRLASELLLGRYQLPAARYPDSLLAKHELGVFKYLRDLLAELGGKHRSEEFNQRVLPQSLRLAEAIGSRMAYEAAKDAGIDPLVLQLFEAGSVNQDLAWYTEAGLLTQKQALDAESATLTALFPHLDQLLEHTGAEPYAYAAIGSEDKWEEFVRSLPVLRGDAYVDLLDPVNSKQARSKL